MERFTFALSEIFRFTSRLISRRQCVWNVESCEDEEHWGMTEKTTWNVSQAHWHSEHSCLHQSWVQTSPFLHLCLLTFEALQNCGNGIANSVCVLSVPLSISQSLHHSNVTYAACFNHLRFLWALQSYFILPIENYFQSVVADNEWQSEQCDTRDNSKTLERSRELHSSVSHLNTLSLSVTNGDLIQETF